MGAVHKGGCLCGAIRYKTMAEPQRVTVCHCTFCQRFTGTAFLFVEPMFKRADVVFWGDKPRTYDHRSDSSHKRIILNFCGRCGTTLYLDLERFPDLLGLCGGTFDDPNWFNRNPGKYRHIFAPSTGRNSAAGWSRHLRSPCNANRRNAEPAHRVCTPCCGTTQTLRKIGSRT